MEFDQLIGIVIVIKERNAYVCYELKYVLCAANFCINDCCNDICDDGCNDGCDDGCDATMAAMISVTMAATVAAMMDVTRRLL